MRGAAPGALLAPAEHPESYSRLRDEKVGLDSAVDELLPWHPPVLTFRRTAARDTELAGTRIRAGDKVVVFHASANHDERVFADPHRLDLARTPNPHVSFGDGPHVCLGAHFARLQVPTRRSRCGRTTAIRRRRGDGVGRLTVYDTVTLKDAGKGSELPGNEGQLGNSAIAVTPGGGSVFVASPSDASLTVFRAPAPPSPSGSPSPSDPASATPSGGTSEPSPGGAGPAAGPMGSGTTVPVDGPTADASSTGGTSGGAESTTGGGSLTTTGDGSLASTGSDVLLPAAAGTAALLAAGTAAVLWRRRGTTT